MLPRMLHAMDLLDLFDDNGLPFDAGPQLSPPRGLQSCSHSQTGSMSHGSSVADPSVYQAGTSIEYPEHAQSPDSSSNESSLLSNLVELGSGKRGLQLLADDDPQSKELIQVLTELGPSTSGQNMPPGTSGKTCSRTTQGSSCSTTLSCKGSSLLGEVQSTRADEKSASHDQKNNLHPTMTHILLHGVEKEELYGPIVPLKDAEFCPTGDLDGSLLYFKNLHHASRSHDISAERTLAANQPMNLFLNESINQFVSEAMNQPMNQLTNQSVNQSASKSVNQAAGPAFPFPGKKLHPDSGKLSGHIASSPDMEFLTGRCSKELVEKKNMCIKSLESTVADTMEKNKNLTCANSILQKENYLLQREVTFVKKALSNQSCIKDILSFHSDKRAGDSEENTVHVQKKAKASPSGEDSRLCIHIGADGTLVSIHSCPQCARIANPKHS